MTMNKKAPEKIETQRLLLRRPRQTDVEAIFRRYASDKEVTKYISWPTHQSFEDTADFLALSDLQWEDWPAGPYLIFLKDHEENIKGDDDDSESKELLLLGSTGLAFQPVSTTNSTTMPPSNEGAYSCCCCAETGYIIAKDSWRKGYATEALQAMITLAPQLGIDELIAKVHPHNVVSCHILRRNGFNEKIIPSCQEDFPNINSLLQKERPQPSTTQIQLFARHFPPKQNSNGL